MNEKPNFAFISSASASLLSVKTTAYSQFRKIMAESESIFCNVSEDVLLMIFSRLEDDPRNWARVACVCKRFSSLIRTVCWKSKCLTSIPSDLLSSTAEPPAGWASLHKISVCCPGLLHAGVYLENSDFGLERELGPDENFKQYESPCGPPADSKGSLNSSTPCASSSNQNENHEIITNSRSDCGWSLYDDLYFDTLYNNSESPYCEFPPIEPPSTSTEHDTSKINSKAGIAEYSATTNKRKLNNGGDGGGGGFLITRWRKVCRPLRSHLASGIRNLSREQGNKLLASRFRGDSLYICDWPGCVHVENKRNYMLFRGIFKNFKRSMVWRTINDGNRSKIDLTCAFCDSKDSWDLQAAFCLKRSFGYHDDGEPVVRAYVCENGHVSGAWTEWPLYT